MDENKFEFENPEAEEKENIIEAEEVLEEPTAYYAKPEEVEPTDQGAGMPFTEIHPPKKEKSRFGSYLLTSLVSVAVCAAVILGLVYGVLPNVGKNEIIVPWSDQVVSTERRNEVVRQEPSEANGEALDIPSVAEKVGPAIVGIVSKGNVSGFFPQTVDLGSGSGIIITEDGYVVTNYHVVEGATEVSVVLSTGEEYSAVLKGADERSDLAVIKIDAHDLPVASFGVSSDMRVGEQVIAIGNPLGLELQGSITVGYLSSANRTIEVDGRDMKLIQTDAAINPGNSGGALVNLYGEVIGINTVKMQATGVEGLGFAIPSDEAKPIIEDILEYGYVRGRPQIGISGQDITDQYARYYNLQPGVLVREVYEGSAAAAAGVQVGDVITKINGTKISSVTELNNEKEKYKAGEEIELTIYRDNKEMAVKLILSEATPE